MHRLDIPVARESQYGAAREGLLAVDTAVSQTQLLYKLQVVLCVTTKYPE